MFCLFSAFYKLPFYRLKEDKSQRRWRPFHPFYNDTWHLSIHVYYITRSFVVTFISEYRKIFFHFLRIASASESCFLPKKIWQRSLNYWRHVSLWSKAYKKILFKKLFLHFWHIAFASKSCSLPSFFLIPLWVFQVPSSTGCYCSD